VTDSTLKTVVALDPETGEYKPAAHNLSASDAVDLVQKFSGENRTAKLLDQEKRHRTSDLTKCGRCKEAAKTVSKDNNHPAETAEPGNRQRSMT
jgi:hypothetical protein